MKKTILFMIAMSLGFSAFAIKKDAEKKDNAVENYRKCVDFWEPKIDELNEIILECNEKYKKTQREAFLLKAHEIQQLRAKREKAQDYCMKNGLEDSKFIYESAI